MNYSKSFWRSLLFFTLIAALCGGMAVPFLAPAQAAPMMQATSCFGTTITQWTFEGSTPFPTTGDGTINVGSGVNTPNFPTSVSADPPAMSVSGWTTNGSLSVNDYIDIAIDTSGRYSLTFSFYASRSNTGPITFDVHYSADGTNFTEFVAAQNILDNETLHSFDFSALVNLDDNPNAIFRLYGYSSGGSSGTFRFDDITLRGSCIFPADTETPTATPTTTITPTNPPPLSVLINEISWGGTVANNTHEWFELYNPGAVDINLANWRLLAEDGDPSIPLSGIIPAGDYFVVAKFLPVFSDLTPDLVYFFNAFSNTGEIMYLLNPNGITVDTANLDGGSWPAGIGSPATSMERIGVVADDSSAWATYGGSAAVAHDSGGNNIRGTPGQGNWVLTVTVTPSPTVTLTRTVTPTRTPTMSRTPTLAPTQTKTPTSAPVQLVAINEFVPRPARDWNNDGLINNDDEFVEIINHGTLSVNLGGYTLDDEADIGSEPYTLPSVTLDPGERIVFYGSETGLLFSDGGDGVRLLKPSNDVADAYNYTAAKYPDQSYCRLPDNGGLDDWNQNCYPTPGLKNTLSGVFINPTGGDDDEPLCPIADTLPLAFYLAECDPFGHNIWSRPYWDDTGWYGEMSLPEYPGKWYIFVD